jgi:hypothetical protein
MQFLIPAKTFSVANHGWFWNFLRPSQAKERGAYQVGADEVYVMPDDTASAHRDWFRLARLDMTKVKMPADWDLKQALASDKSRQTLLIMHGTGSGYGDILSGAYAVDRLKELFRRNGKVLKVAALCREIATVNYYDVCRIRDSFDEVLPFAMTLYEVGQYDWILNTETLIAETAFQTNNFYDYWLIKFGMDPKDEPKNASVAPSPRVMAYMQDECKAIREKLGPGDPLCVLHIHATRLRWIPYQARTELAQALAKKFRLVLTAGFSDAPEIAEWLREMPEDLKARVFDATPYTIRGWDYMGGILQYLADVVVCPDTGVLHLAGILRRPTVAVMFTIEPELRCRYFPTVKAYVAPEWREGPYWGESKLKGKDNLAVLERVNRRDMSDDYLRMWKAFKPDEVVTLAEEALALPKEKPVLTGYRTRQHPRVAVMAYEPETEYFDDRLTLMLVPSILPGDATVDYFPWRPYHHFPLCNYDLVIFGAGSGLNGNVVDQPCLVELLRAARQSIGIFGIEQHAGVHPGRFAELVAALDHWYARTEADLRFLPELPSNAKHLGLWQMTLWPMTEWSWDDCLNIKDQAKAAHAVDRAMLDIPRARRCVSHHLGPFLCALTGAEEVQYVEQFSTDGNNPTGAFGDACEDIFGERFATKHWIEVKREKVAQYKQRVAENVNDLRVAIYGMLGRKP